MEEARTSILFRHWDMMSIVGLALVEMLRLPSRLQYQTQLMSMRLPSHRYCEDKNLKRSSIAVQVP